MLILVIIMLLIGSLFLTLAAASGFVLLYGVNRRPRNWVGESRV